MVIVFDLDDTLSETDAYSEAYIKHFFKTHNLPYQQIATTTRFAEAKFDWPLDVALSWYKQYGDQMMLQFPCKPGVRKLLRRLREDGHTIVIATARDKNWHAEPEKTTRLWLKQNGLVYDKLYTCRQDKECICEEVNADVFIDDDLQLIQNTAKHFAAQNKPFTCLLMHSAYNSTFPAAEGVKRVVNAEQVYTEIAALEKEITRK